MKVNNTNLVPKLLNKDKDICLTNPSEVLIVAKITNAKIS